MLTFQGKWTHPASQPSSPLLTQSWFFMIRISPWVWGKDAVNLLQWLMISVWLNCQFPFHNQEDSREKTRFWLSNQNKSHSYLSQYFLSHISLWCISFPFPCFGQFLTAEFCFNAAILSRQDTWLYNTFNCARFLIDIIFVHFYVINCDVLICVCIGIKVIMVITLNILFLYDENVFFLKKASLLFLYIQ